MTMKTNAENQNIIHEIRQNGRIVLDSDCELLLPMIFNNLTGHNIPDAQQYNDYIEYIAIRNMGFTRGEIELVKNGEVVAKRYITKK